MTQAPYKTNWENVAQGSYNLTAKATDNLGATTTSAVVPVAVTKNAPKMYDIHADHLNTPRVITDNAGTEVWRWDSAPFGETLPNEQPDANASSKFTFNQRFPGQYFDAESNLHYNYFRDYDPASGRYVQSDPIGLGGGINTYGYVRGDAVSQVDPFGLANGPGVNVILGDPNTMPKGFVSGAMSFPRGVYRTIRYAARYTGMFGKCEKQKAQREDEYFSKGTEAYKNDPEFRDKANKKGAEYVGQHGTYLKGRATAGAAAGAFTPLFLGPIWSIAAINGDIRYGIEQGRDLVDAFGAGVLGLPDGGNEPESCECKK